MSKTVLSTIAAIEDALSDPDGSIDRIRLFARSLRWRPTFDAEDLAALVALAERIRGERGDDRWDIERAVLEILCDHAMVAHLTFLLNAYHFRGLHGDDRRRLAMQGLSRIAAIDKNQQALDALENALSHNKADTRGWAIGFIANVYSPTGQPLPEPIIEQFHTMIEKDASMDVRVEAANALARSGAVDQEFIDAVVANAKAQKDAP